MAKVKILPPSQLYHPVLPVKKHNRLFFPLCLKCTEELRDDFCNHSDEERCLTGTWVVDELRLAQEMGYKIKEIYEVWSYKMTQYNGRDGGLFVGYINAFLKLKQEASGWPEWVQTEEDKDRYIRDFERREGIKLDKNNVKNNKGFRALAKLMLNSFWGRHL